MPVRYLLNAVLLAVFLVAVNTLVAGGAISVSKSKVIVLIGINIILAVSLNVATGYLGQLPLGHAGFVAVGAYASAILMKRMGASALGILSLAGLKKRCGGGALSVRMRSAADGRPVRLDDRHPGPASQWRHLPSSPSVSA
jgi:ABC-type branched-subunit amino acid transport system permease subunit